MALSNFAGGEKGSSRKKDTVWLLQEVYKKLSERKTLEIARRRDIVTKNVNAGLAQKAKLQSLSC